MTSEKSRSVNNLITQTTSSYLRTKPIYLRHRCWRFHVNADVGPWKKEMTPMSHMTETPPLFWNWMGAEMKSLAKLWCKCSFHNPSYTNSRVAMDVIMWSIRALCIYPTVEPPAHQLLPVLTPGFRSMNCTVSEGRLKPSLATSRISTALVYINPPSTYSKYCDVPSCDVSGTTGQYGIVGLASADKFGVVVPEKTLGSVLRDVKLESDPDHGKSWAKTRGLPTVTVSNWFFSINSLPSGANVGLFGRQSSGGSSIWNKRCVTG